MKLLYIIVISIIILIVLGLGIYILTSSKCDSGFRKVNCDKNSKISSYCVKEEENLEKDADVAPCDLCTLGEE